MEQDGDDVVAAGGPQQSVDGDHRGQERRPRRGVARSLEQVVLPLVAGHPRLERAGSVGR